jgi:secondary thiamine-phosphate synthase enzyme
LTSGRRADRVSTLPLKHGPGASGCPTAARVGEITGDQFEGEEQMNNLALSAVEKQPKIETKEGTYKVASTTLIFKTTERVEIKSITKEITAFVEQTPIRDGIIQISSLHTTAGLMLNETQGALLSDITSMFEQIIPRGVYYKHNDPLLSDCDRKNADAHLRVVIVGQYLSIPIVDGKLKLGTWQNILLTEFDGPNNRQVHVQVMGI